MAAKDPLIVGISTSAAVQAHACTRMCMHLYHAYSAPRLRCCHGAQVLHASGAVSLLLYNISYHDAVIHVVALPLNACTVKLCHHQNFAPPLPQNHLHAALFNPCMAPGLNHDPSCLFWGLTLGSFTHWAAVAPSSTSRCRQKSALSWTCWAQLAQCTSCSGPSTPVASTAS